MGLMIFGIILLLAATVVLKLLPTTKTEQYLDENHQKQTREVQTSLGNAVGKIKSFIYGIPAAIIALGAFNGAFFYAEPGYQYHVKTLWGTEYHVNDTGWAINGFKEPVAWKKAMSIILTNEVDSQGNQIHASYVGPAYSSRLLDNVDAKIDATVRVRIPSDEATFLKMAREYRTPENLINTSLLPAVKQTLNSNSSLMGAEEYYSGGRTEFNNEFEKQMTNGIYQVKRIEKRVKTQQDQLASANATKATKQNQYGDGMKTVFIVQKKLDANGLPIINPHNFADFGVEIVSAVVTDLEPNKKFIQRMELKQQAAADRAIAKEQRMQEQEAKLLAEAKGQREVAQEKALALKTQIKQTTDAETTKQLALTKQTQLLEAAEIEEQTATVQLRTANLNAKKVKTLADAEAYKKRELLRANGQLEERLKNHLEVQRVWAAAASQMKVPSTVFMTGAGSSSSYPTSTSSAEQFMQLMTMKAAKDLKFDPKPQK